MSLYFNVDTIGITTAGKMAPWLTWFVGAFYCIHMSIKTMPMYVIILYSDHWSVIYNGRYERHITMIVNSDDCRIRRRAGMGSDCRYLNAWFNKLWISAHVCWNHCPCDKVYHKQDVRFLLYILSQIVTWQYIPNRLDLNWPCNVKMIMIDSCGTIHWPIDNQPSFSGLHKLRIAWLNF